MRHRLGLATRTQISVCKLPIWHSRWLKLVPFESFGAVSYSPSIVTMALSCIVCELQRLIGRKSLNFYTPHVFSALAEGCPVGISWGCLMLIKLEWFDYRMVKKTMTIRRLSRFHRIPERNGRTDIFAVSISCVSMLTREKKPFLLQKICDEVFSREHHHCKLGLYQADWRDWPPLACYDFIKIIKWASCHLLLYM